MNTFTAESQVADDVSHLAALFLGCNQRDKMVHDRRLADAP
jgi:hypothetical protein